MEMKVLQRSYNVSHVALVGRLDATTADQIEADFGAAVSEQDRPAMVDVSGIEFMASRGIGLLITQAKRLIKGGHKLVILNPQGMVDVVMKSSKMDKIMPLAYSEQEALILLLGAEAAAAAASAETAEEAGVVGDQAQTDVEFDTCLQLQIKNAMSEFDHLNATVAQFLRYHNVPQRAAYAIDLALEELIVNVLRYAYMDDDTHMIDIELGIEAEQIILRIADDGREFDPRKGPTLDLHAEDRDVGGLGILLVLDLVDLLKYQREDEKNKVEVRVHIIPEVEPTDQEEDESSAAPQASDDSEEVAQAAGDSED